MSTINEKVNILLVDDQPAKLIAHEAILSDLEERVVSVQSGVAALRFLLHNECAVIVLDVNMPGMDGFETAALIRGRPSLERTPIIFVSAYNVSDLDRLKGYGIGAVDYLFIPVVPEVLRAKVQAFVELFRQRRLIQNQADHLAQQNREMEAQIRTIQALNDRLRTANEELEAFSYSVSHDLRAPLRAMHGYSEILVNDFKDGLAPKGVDYLHRICRAANRMDGLIQDILAYTRVAKAELSLEPVDLEALISSLIDTNGALQPPRAQVSVDSPLAPVVAHEACLAQCLSNLLANAAKFVPAGRVPEIRVRTESSEEAVRIWVEDNGIGIAPTQHARIFQMFGKIHNDKAYEGNGIGLSIVRKGAERMRGKVGVESTPGIGSRFWVELPAVTKAVSVAPA